MAGLEGTLEILLSGINAPIFVCLEYKRILTFFQNELEKLSLGLLAWWTMLCAVNWWLMADITQILTVGPIQSLHLAECLFLIFKYVKIRPLLNSFSETKLCKQEKQTHLLLPVVSEPLEVMAFLAGSATVDDPRLPFRSSGFSVCSPNQLGYA